MEVCDKSKYFCNKIVEPERIKIEMIRYFNGILRAYKAKKDNKDPKHIEYVEKKIEEMKENTGEYVCDLAAKYACPE